LTGHKAHFRSRIALILAGIVTIGLSVGVSFLFPWSSIPYWAVDFTVFYAAASSIASGANPYIMANLAQYVPPDTINPVLSYSYPPLLALLLVPSTALSLDTAARFWLTVNLLAPGVGIGMILKATGWKPKPIQLGALVLASMLFLPCLYTYLSGQASLWSLLWVSVGVFLVSRGHHASTGASLAMAWVKPHPLPLVPIDLLFRNRRALIAFTGILLTSLAMVTLWLPSWPEAIMGAFKANANQQEILYQATALGVASYLGPVGLIVRGAAGMTAIGLIIALARRRVDWRTLTIAQLSLGLLVAPYIGRCDVAIALIPILLILSDRRSAVRPAALLATAAWCSSFICVLLRILLNIDWLLLPLVWGGLTQWTLAAASAWYVKIMLQHFDNTPSTL
jgi:hypothetical protein